MPNNNQTDNFHEKLIDLELAKNENNSFARRMLPAIALMISFHYSALFAIGMLIGYLASKLFAKYFLEKGRVECIYIDWGKNWKIHVHHWILGVLILIIVGIIDYFYLPRFFSGMIVGLIAHDIYDYNDWYRVVIRNK